MKKEIIGNQLSIFSLSVVQISHLGEIAKVMDCSLEVSDFKLQSRFVIHFLTYTFGNCFEPLHVPLCCCSSRRKSMSLDN